MGYYKEKHRPQYHFSPKNNWMNDPNGMVYHDGEFHLFYQHYPDSPVWGPMHWGHAVSTDLLHWRHLPIALFPDSLGYIFSGSAVVDNENRSGLGTGETSAIIAIFTYHNSKLQKKGINSYQSQGIAYSIDKGRTWIKHSKNPVLENPGINDFRDPKVFWHNFTEKWIMVLAVNDRVHLYSSPNLLDWDFESEFGDKAGTHDGVWECPDLFQLQVGESDEMSWCMLVSINQGGPNGGSATQYFTGKFDGHKFTPDSTDVRWVDWGTDNYAGVTWSNIPLDDGRRIFIGWMSNWDYAMVVPTDIWRSAMTLPRELSLIEKNDQYFLVSRPVRELEKIRKQSDNVIQRTKINGEYRIGVDEFSLMQSELVFEFNQDNKVVDAFGIKLENNMGEKLVIGYSENNKHVFIDRKNAGNPFSEKFAGVLTTPYRAGCVLKLHVFIDAASVELFVDDGTLVMTSIVFPSEKFDKLYVFSNGGEILIDDMKMYGIETIW